MQLLFYIFFLFQRYFPYTVYKRVHLDKIISSNCVSVYITFNDEDDSHSERLIVQLYSLTFSLSNDK